MTTLQIGDKAPDFKAIDEEKNKRRLKDYQGKKLVLFFYPRANTPDCTMEASNLRDHYQMFLSKGYDVLGVSADSSEKQLKWKKKLQLPFHLLADEDKVVLNAYRVWGAKKFMGRTYDGIYRTTFVIDENGIIEDIITKVKTKVHTSQILKE